MPSGEIARITSIIYGISWAEACYSVEVAIANPFNKYFQAVEIGWFVFVDSKHTEAKIIFFFSDQRQKESMEKWNGRKCFYLLR